MHSTNVNIHNKLLYSNQQQSLVTTFNNIFQKILCELQQGNEKNLAKSIWPSIISCNKKIKPLLVIEPMNRLGGDFGKAGNTVLAGRLFHSEQSPNILPSIPLIIKITPDPDLFKSNNADRINKIKKMLKDEWAASNYLEHLFSERNQFALPIYFEECPNQCNVLVAPLFSNTSPPSTTSNRELSTHAMIQDIYQILSLYRNNLQHDERKRKLHNIISSLKYLQLAHCTPSADNTDKINLIEHYSWELRDFTNYVRGQDINYPTKYWIDTWGENKYISDHGYHDWINPLFTINKINKDLGLINVRTGAIHGDMHPRNIVLTENNTARIIDFGWTRPVNRKHEYQHIMKDFVLMEANIKFMSLPPHLPNSDIDLISKYINYTTYFEPQSNETMFRKELIDKIRNIAKDHNFNSINWLYEYFIPLFFVSLGLLKYCHEAECTWAFRKSILYLSNYIYNNVNT